MKMEEKLAEGGRGIERWKREKKNLEKREGRALRYKEFPETERRREIACGKAVLGWYAARGEMEMAAFDQVEACLDIAKLHGWGRQTWGKAEKRKNGEGRWI